MSATTVAHHALRQAVEEQPRRGLFSRFVGWLQVATATEAEPETYEDGAGFPESPEAAEMRERPASPDPAHVQTEAPSGQTVGMQVPPEKPEPRPEPPLVYMPAPPQDVLRNIAHAAMDMIGRDVDNQGAYERLQIHMAELLKRARQTEHLLVRSQSNVAESAMDAALLAAADRRGESAEELEQRAARVQADILARARRASDPTPTGTLPRITEDTPDPSAPEGEEPTVEIEPDHPWTPDEAEHAQDIAHADELERQGRELDADAERQVA